MAGLEFRVSCIKHLVVQKHPLNLPSRELAFLQIYHLGKRKIIDSKVPQRADIVPRRVFTELLMTSGTFTLSNSPKENHHSILIHPPISLSNAERPLRNRKKDILPPKNFDIVHTQEPGVEKRLDKFFWSVEKWWTRKAYSNTFSNLTGL